MIGYILVSTVLSYVAGIIWLQTLFPQAAQDMSGSAENARRRQSRVNSMTFLFLLLFTAAFGAFLSHRGVVDVSDGLRVAIKVWIGFLLPPLAVAWSRTLAPFRTFLAFASQWLVVALLTTLLAMWFLLS